MSLAFAVFKEKSRLRAPFDHVSIIDDPRDPRRVAYPLAEVLLLLVCGTMADCDVLMNRLKASKFMAANSMARVCAPL